MRIGSLRVLSVLVGAALLISAPARAEEGAEETVNRGVGLEAFAGGALDRGGLLVGVGAQHAFSARLSGGLSAELSPWVDVLSGKVAPGVANGYATLRWRWLSLPGAEVRSLVHLGTSVLLFEVVGARAGLVGVFAGLALLGLSLRLTDRWWLDFTPEVTLSAPSLSGVPLIYRQYRLAVGLVRWL